MSTTEAIEFSLSEALQCNQATSLRFEQPGLARTAIDTEALSGATLTRTRTATETRRLLIPVQRAEPVVTIYFQLARNCRYNCPDDVRVPERRHALCYVPALRFDYVVAGRKTRSLGRSPSVRI